MFQRKAAIKGYYFESSEDFLAKILGIQSTRLKCKYLEDDH